MRITQAKRPRESAVDFTIASNLRASITFSSGHEKQAGHYAFFAEQLSLSRCATRPTKSRSIQRAVFAARIMKIDAALDKAKRRLASFLASNAAV